MRFYKWYAILLMIILSQAIAGCGGGGGGGGGGASPPITDTTAPTVSSFTLPATSASLIVPISSLIATDAVGVTGYLITESATAPLGSATGWSLTAPISFTFSATGSRTAFAWAKDAAGNVSASRSANVTIITTKTITLKFISQSTNSSDRIGGFLLTVTLPPGSVLQVDSSGTPLSSAVYLSGQFAGTSPQIINYDSVSKELTINYASANEYSLGEFITIITTVPSSYVPNTNDLTQSFTAWNASGAQLMTVTATATFN